MVYMVKFSQHAARSFRKMPRDVQMRLHKAIESLKKSPRPTGSEKLKGSEDTYRVRVGGYRILYEVRDRELLVYIVDTGHRKEVYR